MATAVDTVKNFMNVLTKYSQDSSEVGIIALDDAIIPNQREWSALQIWRTRLKAFRQFLHLMNFAVNL